MRHLGFELILPVKGIAELKLASGVKVSDIEGGPGCGWTCGFYDINDYKLITWSGYTTEHDRY